MRADRLLALLMLLQARGRVTAPAVARELEISIRTVYRDVAALSAAGVPVHSEQGFGGGIRLMPGYHTDVTALTAAETRALVALSGQAVPDDLGLGSALVSAMRKLVAALPDSRREEALRSAQRVLVDHSGWYLPTSTPAYLTVVQEAVWSDRRIRLRYRHGDGRPGTYLLDPYGLVVKAGVWYLVAAHRRQVRLFRVDRMDAVTPLEQASHRPAELDLAALWHELRAGLETPRAAVRVRLRVRVDRCAMLLRVTAPQRVVQESESAKASELLESPATPDEDGMIGLELCFRSLPAARGALAGFGAAVEVLEPTQLRADLAAVARELLALYDRPGPSGAE